jgi:putative transcriptional regulator
MELPHLNGSILIAAPQMRDPTFSRSVLLLAGYEATRGAFGYILNTPLGKVVADLISGEEHAALADVEVFFGGPVAEDKLTFAALRWSQKHDKVLIKAQLSLDEAVEQRALGREVRAFVGYSGWAQGQLEKELRKRAWIVSQPQRFLLESSDDETLWKRVLEKMGTQFALLAAVPVEPELN